MTLAIDTFPLQWPAGWKRTPSHHRRKSDYRVDFSKARDDLVHEVRLLGSRREDIVVSSNLQLRRDGFPLSSQREPDDPGIAVYWIARRFNRATNQTDFQQRVIACDVWRSARENMRAIGLAVASLRMLERTGASEILDRAFTGFAALPISTTTSAEWAVELGIPDIVRSLDITEEMIEERYRERARTSHPDAGGSHDAMVRLNKAREEALAFVRGRRS